jgi:hypothetical protein
MANEFKIFADAIKRNFKHMKEFSLFIVDCSKDELWDHYLNSFPKGTNDIYREKSFHDCSCCRSFIKNMGNVVSIENGVLNSIWNILNLPEPYQTVSLKMHEFVVSHKIRDVFVTKESLYGTEYNHELIDGKSHRYDHFSLSIPVEFVCSKPEEEKGDLRTSYQVLKRGLEDFTEEALETVLELINSNSLYRGDQYKKPITDFLALKRKIESFNDYNKDLLIWSNVTNYIARFRNTVIGSLLEDIVLGEDIEVAVRSFESKVAPENYKRSSAIITPFMVKNAINTLKELGLESAIERRYAKFSDIDVNSVLYVNRQSKAHMKGGLEDLLLEEVKPNPFNKNRAADINIKEFIHNVIPKCTSIRAFIENDKLSNMMSLTAPVHEDANNLFTWNNGIAWGYETGTDSSIRARVKKAGGRVENVNLRVSLSWFNTDDLDLHIIEPNNNEIYFGNKCDKLDVDMNAGVGTCTDPVENTRWIDKLPNGKYQVKVNQFAKRNSVNGGFEIEIEKDGVLKNYTYGKILPNKSKVHVCDITVTNNKILAITLVDKDITSEAISKDYWGIKTNDLIEVNSIILSPNHWDEDHPHGNKHWFFILNKCVNPESIRGFYNEFLKSDLIKHRKVFEVLADKTKCAYTPDQLSGIGFSSTIQNNLLVQVTGPNINKIYNIQFGKN